MIFVTTDDFFRFQISEIRWSANAQDCQADNHLIVVPGLTKARFIRPIFVVSNAIQTIDNETAYPMIYCLNCIRHDENSTHETGQNDNEILRPEILDAKHV